MKISKIQEYDRRWKDIVFFRNDGQQAENAVYWAEDIHTGEIVFYELLGVSGAGGVPCFTLNKKNVYKRLLIIRVFPYTLEEKCAASGTLDEQTEYEIAGGNS